MKKQKKTLTLGAYKLVELAKIEGVHPNTVHKRKASGKYVEIAMRSPSGKVSTRYLTAEASAAVLAVFSAVAREPHEFFPEVPHDPPESLASVGYPAHGSDTGQPSAEAFRKIDEGRTPLATDEF